MGPTAAHTHKAITAELRAAAEAFGRNLRRWRVAQGWSQNTPQEWAQAIGIAPVFNSQWSQLECALLRGPKPMVFRALGAMNCLLAAGQYGRIRDKDLLERVKAARPICHPDGKPWNGGDFWDAFTGQLEWPAIIEARPPVTDDEAAAISADLREGVKAEAKRRRKPVGAAAGDLLDTVPEDHQARMEDVLFGDDWSGAELTKLRDDEGRLLPVAWLEAWRAGGV